MSAEAASAHGDDARWRRLLVTIAAALVAIEVLPRVLLPGVNGEALSALGRGMRGTLDVSALSVASLGLSPVLSAFALVELVALVIPALRPRRHTPEGRRALGRVTLVLAIVFAGVQGFFVARWLSGFEHSMRSLGAPIFEGGLGAELLVALTLVAGTMALVALAFLIDRYGLGSGFAILLVAPLAAEVLPAIARVVMRGDVAPLEIVLVIALAAATALGVRRALTWRAPIDRAVAADGLRLPTSGVVPIYIAASLMMLCRQVAALASLDARWLQPGDTIGFVVENTLVVAIGAALSLAFFRGVRDRLARSRAIVMSLALLVALVAVAGAPALLLRVGLRVDVLGLAFAVALLLDLTAEWRARRELGALTPVWPLHRVRSVDAVMRVLDDAGVRAHVRSVHQRALFHFFAPWLPMDVMVAPPDAARATALLRDHATRA